MVKQNIMSGNFLIQSLRVFRAGGNKHFDRRGFTLIELMIVVSIIGILAAIAVPNYQWGIIKAREAVLREDLYNIRSVIDQFHADQGKYPSSIDELKVKGYMREIPKDPFTGQDDWKTDPPQSPSGTSTESGVADVHSNSDKISPTNNTSYSTW